MKHVSSLLTIVAALAASLTLSASAGPIGLAAYGFEIEPLDAKPEEGTTMALTTSLPAMDGFSPNINVIIQFYKGSIDEFAKLSRTQFTSLGWKVFKDKKVNEQEWMFEYAGKLPQGDLHFYARAVSKGDRVYVVTGTAKENQWEKVGATLTKHVESFKAK